MNKLTEEIELDDDSLDYCCEDDVLESNNVRYVPPALYTEEIVSTKLIETDEYAEGTKMALKWAGYINTLLSVGLSTEEAFSLCINEQTAEANLQMAKAGYIQQKKSNPLG